MERKVMQTDLRLKTWNGSAMIPGLTYHLQGVHDARKTAVIVKELSRLDVDIIVSLSKRPGPQESPRLHSFIWSVSLISIYAHTLIS